jgi:hypothetical protein
MMSCGLEVDGILKPGGEIESSLFETLTRRTSEERSISALFK